MSNKKATPGKNPGAPPPPRRALTTKGTVLPVGKRAQVRSRKLEAKSTAFLPADESSDYEDYIEPTTQGLVKPLINGRNSNGADIDIDLTEPLNEMELTVQKLKAGDYVYLSAWFFEPATRLTSGLSFGISTWGELFAQRAMAGVKIRILINDFDPVSRMDTWLQRDGLDPLKDIVEAMPEASRDNLKFTVSLHPAHVGSLKAMLSGVKADKIHVASHHQKFMVTRNSGEMVSFCGGLDIESRKTPHNWSYGDLTGWHDIHFRAEGPIAYDLEREFVMRWNREKDSATKNPVIAGWKPHEVLTQSPLTPIDDVPSKKVHKVQMLRTVSSDAVLSPFSNERDDISKVYLNIVHGAKDYLYFENQYFRSQPLADAIAARGRANKKLEVVFVVVFSAGADDGANAVTSHGDYLQNLFFKKVTDVFVKRCGIYTMTDRAVHSKLLIADDEVILGGSANANARSFELDSELNLSIEDLGLAASFRKRLWAHNLGQAESGVADASKMIALFDAASATNASRPPPEMLGEGIVKYDFTKATGEKSLLIPDALAYLDIDDHKDPQGEGRVVRRGGGAVA